MKHLLLAGLVMGLSGQALANVFISEYIEGSSNNKAIEIYNGTGADLDLNTISFRRITNGTSIYDFALTDYADQIASMTLADGDVFVVCNSSSVAAITAVSDLVGSAICYHNGDDAIILLQDGVIIDAVGPNDLYTDPGTGWDVAGVTNATADHTLVRKIEVTAGNLDWDASRGTNATDSEWIVLDVDTFGSLGSHGGAVDTPPVIANMMHSPAVPADTDIVTVSADVTDDSAVSSVTLFYSVNGGIESSAAMSLSAGDTYTGTIPAQANTASVVYRVEATDDALQVTSLSGGAYVVGGTPTVSIYDIQFTEDVSGDSPLLGQTVEVTGIVTAIGASGAGSIFIQDGAGPWSGIQVYGTGTAFAVGDEVTANGPVVEYFNQTEIDVSGANGPGSYTINSSGNAAYAIPVVTFAEAFGESYESMVVSIQGGTAMTAPNTYGEWDISDGVTTGTVDDFFFATSPIVGQCYDLTGVIYYAYSLMRIEPRSAAEMTPCGGGNLPPAISNLAHSPLIPTSADIVTVTADITDNSAVAGADLYYSVDAGAAISVAMVLSAGTTYTADIPAQADGSAVAFYVVATDDEAESTTSGTQNYSVIDGFTCGDISTIRANDVDGVPVLNGQAVQICGVLTVGQEFGASGPAYLTHATGSVAIYGGVLGSSTVAIGDEVQAMGLVGGYNGLTQVLDLTMLTVVASPGAPAPTVVTLADMIANGEAYEAQLLRVNGVSLVDPLGWPASGSHATIQITDGVDTFDLRIDRDSDLDENAAPTGSFDLIGVMGQYDTTLPWDTGYQIQPRTYADVIYVAQPTDLTIAQIQTPTDTTDVSPYAGQLVRTTGIVSALTTSGSGGFFMQDAAGAWSGVQVYGANGGVAIGDEVQVTGNVLEYFTFTEIEVADSTAYSVLSSGNTPYAASLQTAADAYSEAYESVLVRVENMSCSNDSLGFGEWEVQDDLLNSYVVDDALFFGFTPVVGECYNLEGVMYYSFGAFKLEPRDAADITTCTTGIDAPVVSIAYIGGLVSLSWDAVAGATDYIVYTSAEGYAGWDAGTSTGGATSLAMPATGKTFFRVVAVN